ncbi:MAG: TonB-dependent receptor, partial [Algicola sp.]|nr:TonB-dependent receptor [Algicola sp.]
MKVVSNNCLFRRTLIASALLGVLSATAPVMANENFSGTVKGHIISGAKATVVLKHQGKGLTRTIVADSDGNYILRKLPVGRYTVTVSKPGFESVVKKDYVVKLGGQIFNPALLSVNNIEKIEITGSQTTYVDLGSSTGSLVVTQEELSLLPVNTGFNSVALLAPGAAKTSGSKFGSSPNIGGSSSAENGYYLNGINITNIRTGLGVVDIPFAAIAQTEAQVGGISSEFGNALGGIINSVSKSGSNEFEFGVKIRHDNEALRSRHGDLRNHDGDIYNNIAQDESDFSRISLEASGPIIKDQLFFYAMLAPQENSYWNMGASSASKGESTSERYMAKLDWYINDNHSLEL